VATSAQFSSVIDSGRPAIRGHLPAHQPLMIR
jgi:hypothetical protein